jgi:hypothetical protein
MYFSSAMSSSDNKYTHASVQQTTYKEQISQPPSETSDSYFPSAQASGQTTPSEGSMTPAETPSFKLPLNSPIGNYPMPALAREFPKPDEDLDIAKQLQKRPLPRSLHSSLKVAASYEKKQADDADTRAEKLRAAKEQWKSWSA